jgi:hypothetical protein
MATRTGSSRATTNRQSSKSTPPEGQARPSAERDENYDLISVLYHTLQGADTIGRYIEDAREAEDDELLEFLRQAQATYAKLGSRAKTLLAARLEEQEIGDSEEDDEEDEEDEED